LLKKIEQVYRLYEEYTASIDSACEKYCADCCTINVTLTGLEGRYLFAGLPQSDHEALADRLSVWRDKARFRPVYSTNAFAMKCRDREDVEDEENRLEWGECPFLHGNACSIYDLRPFGCRSMISRQKCAEHGYADMDQYLLTLNTVFMQFIEHMDTGGFFGNLTDVLLRLSGGNDPQLATTLNNPIPALMVPPAHQKEIAPVVDELARIVATPLERACDIP